MPSGGGTERPQSQVAPPPRRALGPTDPSQAGPYRLEAVLGEGGMGRVYLGRTPAGSEVAVKLVHREFAADASFRKRFEQEVAAARRVQGLYTVPVVDADLQADEPWLATAYVPGPSLQYAVDEGGPLSAQAAAGLVARVAEALQSIHAAGVIHRDLKPANIILSAEGPKVIDFGIARAADVTSVTGTGVRAGTPAYMAPEYIQGQSLTEAVDLFALGLVAHFAVTGRLAFGGGSGYGVAYRILEQEPDLDGCPEPLRTIAVRCLEKDPARRPGPAEVIELSRGAPADVGTVVDVHSAPTEPAQPAPPVRPAPPGAAPDPARQPAGRVPGQGTPAGARDAASPDAPAADAQTVDARSVGPQPGGTPAGAGSSAGSGGGKLSGPALAGVVCALLAVAGLIVSLLYLPESGAGSGSRDVPRLASTTELTESSGLVYAVALSPDAKTLAAGTEKGRIRLWDVARRERSATLQQRDADGAKEVQGIGGVAFSPDGRMLAAAAGGGRVGLWDVKQRRQLATLEASRLPVDDVEFSPDSRLLATGGEDGEVKLWNARDRKTGPVAVLEHEQRVRSVAFSPDGRTLAAAVSSDGPPSTVKLWDVADHTVRRTMEHHAAVMGAAFADRGRSVFTASTDGKIQRWGAGDGGGGDPLTAEGVTTGDGLVSSPDGDTLATLHLKEVRLWNPGEGSQRAVLQGHRTGVEDVAVSRGGRLVATTDGSETVRLWKNPGAGD